MRKAQNADEAAQVAKAGGTLGFSDDEQMVVVADFVTILACKNVELELVVDFQAISIVSGDISSDSKYSQMIEAGWICVRIQVERRTDTCVTCAYFAKLKDEA